MFEVGKNYTIYEIDSDGIGYHSATVLDWQPPLLKVSHPNGSYVVHNTSSSNFHKAELSERQPASQFTPQDMRFQPE